MIIRLSGHLISIFSLFHMQLEMLLLNPQTSQQWPQTNGGNGVDTGFYVMTRCPTRGPPKWTGVVLDPCTLTHRITYRNSFIIINILQKDIFHWKFLFNTQLGCHKKSLLGCKPKCFCDKKKIQSSVVSQNVYVTRKRYNLVL